MISSSRSTRGRSRSRAGSASRRARRRRSPRRRVRGDAWRRCCPTDLDGRVAGDKHRDGAGELLADVGAAECDGSQGLRRVQQERRDSRDRWKLVDGHAAIPDRSRAVQPRGDARRQAARRDAQGRAAACRCSTSPPASRVMNEKTSITLAHGVTVSSDSRYAFVSVEGKGAQTGKVEIFDLNVVHEGGDGGRRPAGERHHVLEDGAEQEVAPGRTTPTTPNTQSMRFHCRVLSPLALVAAAHLHAQGPATETARDTARKVLVVAGPARAARASFPLTNYAETKPLVAGQIDWKHYHTLGRDRGVHAQVGAASIPTSSSSTWSASASAAATSGR